MPVIFSKEWWNSPTNIISDVFQGAGLGWLLGQVEDAKADRHAIIGLLQRQAADRERELAARVGAEIEAMEDSPWGWKCITSRAHMIEVALHSQSNPAYMEVHRSLLQQWNPLYRRALELQVCPLAPGMPRSIAGDIAGIPRQLVLGMESLGERINEEEVRRGLAETDFERVVVDDAVLKDDEPAATGSQGRLLTQLEASEASGIWSLTLLELICMKEIPGHDLDIPERPAESIEHFLRRAQRHNCTYEADIERLLKRIHILEYFDYVPDKVKQLEKDQADAAWGG